MTIAPRKQRGEHMNRWLRRLLSAITIHAMLAGCQSAPAPGEYVTFVRDVMAESARLDEEAGEGPDRTEPVEEAVRVWRDAGEDEE